MVKKKSNKKNSALKKVGRPRKYAIPSKFNVGDYFFMHSKYSPAIILTHACKKLGIKVMSEKQKAISKQKIYKVTRIL